MHTASSSLPRPVSQGALIGLLFVAVSVSTERSEDAATRVEFQSRSAAALLVFTNALLISMAALVPGGEPGLVGDRVRRRRPDVRHRHHPFHRDCGSSVAGKCGLGVVGRRIVRDRRLRVVRGGGTARPSVSPGCGTYLSYVVIGDLAFGIARAWQLVGLRDTGVVTSLRILLGREAHSSPHVDGGERPAT